MEEEVWIARVKVMVGSWRESLSFHRDPCAIRQFRHLGIFPESPPAGVGTVRFRRLPRFHRARPSTFLDIALLELTKIRYWTRISIQTKIVKKIFSPSNLGFERFVDRWRWKR